jgi:hypothetical protein
MRVVWSAEVSLLVVTLYTMRQEFASEILTVSLHTYCIIYHLCSMPQPEPVDGLVKSRKHLIPFRISLDYLHKRMK